MTCETILVETRGKVGLITLNRPQALNALNARLVAEMGRALDAFEADDAIGAIVVTGSEKAFAAGADIKEMQAKTFMQAYKGDFIGSWERVARCRKQEACSTRGSNEPAPESAPRPRRGAATRPAHEPDERDHDADGEQGGVRDEHSANPTVKTACAKGLSRVLLALRRDPS